MGERYQLDSEGTRATRDQTAHPAEALAVEGQHVPIKGYRRPDRAQSRKVQMVRVRLHDGTEIHVEPRRLVRLWSEAERIIAARARASEMERRLERLLGPDWYVDVSSDGHVRLMSRSDNYEPAEKLAHRLEYSQVES